MIRAFKARPSVPRGRLFALLSALAIAASLGAAGSASASELVVNGSFETGTLEGWKTFSQTGKGAWFTYSRKAQAEHGSPAFAPQSGEYAVQDSFDSPDTVTLLQEIALPAGSTDELAMSLFYKSTAPMSVPAPDTLEVQPSEGGHGNQQLRIDVLRAGAPIGTLAPGDILATVFATTSGSAEELAPTVLHADLSPLAGQTVTLRIVNAAEDGDMEAGVDGVSITSSPIPSPVVVPTPPAASPAPSNLFTRGKLTLDKRTGTARLKVNVPDAGTLIATDARRKVAIASRRREGRPQPIYVRSATVTSSGAGTITVPIKPTAAAMKVLERKGSLPVRLTMTFVPAGGAASTQPFATKLVRRLRPAPAPR